jgi:type II secretory pathway component GspD/PulD (secretin)
MKTTVALSLAVCLFLLVGCSRSHPAREYKTTYSSFDLPEEHPADTAVSSGAINFQNTPVDQVLEIYQKLSGRTVIRGPLPNATINLSSQTPFTRIQALQMLDTVLAENGIVMVLSGDTAVKAVPVGRAFAFHPAEITLPWEQLPDSSSVMTRTVRMKHVRPSMVVPVLAPLSKLPDSIMCMDGENLLVLRDYASNIRQELQMLEKVDKSKTP